SCAAAADQLTFEFKGVRFPNADGTNAYDINNSGVIVGSYFITGVATYGFILDHGDGTQVVYPGSTATQCLGINSFSDVVGVYTAQDGTNHAFLLKAGVYTNLIPNGSSAANGINDNGDIVGVMTECVNCAAHAFLLKDGKLKQLPDVPGSAFTSAGSINNA